MRNESIYYSELEDSLNTPQKLLKQMDQTRTFLIVDDNFFNIEVLRTLMQKVYSNRIKIDFALSGQQAVDKVIQILREGGEFYDFILMDINMPMMNGF